MAIGYIILNMLIYVDNRFITFQNYIFTKVKVYILERDDQILMTRYNSL